jgi:hypothetical protein
MAKSNNKMKKTWNVLKNQAGELQPTEQFPSLRVKNEESGYPTVVANACNNFFLTVTEK